MEAISRRVAMNFKGGKVNASSNNNLNLIQEEEAHHFPYTSKEIKNHILELDLEIFRLAKV
jgi:hypothetical protein